MNSRIISRAGRLQILGIVFHIFCFAANITALLFLGFLLMDVFMRGSATLSWDFLINYPSRFPHKSGALSAIAGTGLLMFLTALIAVPMGVGTAVYLEEFSSKNIFINFININIKNLAGVPSIIYGILGLTIFVRGIGLGRSILAGSLTMALLVLPIITIAAQEALRAVPNSLRQAGFGIGMTPLQVVRYQTLPLAIPGMMTGIILALSRAIGESAPMIMLGALTFVTFVPTSLLDSFTVLPIQIFNWTARPQKGFHEIAATGIIVLFVILLLMNTLAIFLRIYYKKKFKDLYA